jgi:hypothetical protein
MKTLLPFYRLILFFFIFSFPVVKAQQDGQSFQTRFQKITKYDGTIFIGKILTQDAREILIDTKEVGQVIIPKHEVKKIEEIKDGEIGLDGEYLPPEIFSTRYFITTNGLPIEKGESYTQWNLFGPDFQFGIAKNLGVGVMTTWFATPIIGSAKYSINLSQNVNLGIGTLLGTGSWVAPDFAMALPFSSLTFGDRRQNLSFSGGYGLIAYGRHTEGRFLASIAIMSKITKKVSFVFDSFIMPEVNYSSDNFAILIPGLRFQFQNESAFQFGFAGLILDNELIKVPLPAFQWFRKL